jgi:hypothetical protein
VTVGAIILNGSLARAVAVVDAWRWPVVTVDTALFVVALGFAVFAAGRSDRVRRAAVLGFVPNWVIPLAAYGAALAARRPADAAALLVPLAAWFALLALAALAVGLALDARGALAGVFGLTALVVAGDQLLGGRLVLANLAAYSLADGGRFYGLGNEGAALLVTGVVAGLALGFPLVAAGARRSYAEFAAVAAFVAVLVFALPTLGANLGAALWGIPALAAVVLAVAGVEMTWRRAGLVVAAVVATVAAVVALDAVLGLTHVGATARAAWASGGASLLVVAARRGATALSVLTGNWLVFVLVALFALLGWALWRPPAALRAAFAARPEARAAAAGLLAAAVIALLTEDTGAGAAALLVPGALTIVAVAALDPRSEMRR